MKSIGNFFEKFKKIISDSEEGKKVLAEAIHGETGINISLEKIKIKDKIAYVSTSPVVKSEIVLKKEKILSRLAGKTFSLTDIR